MYWRFERYWRELREWLARPHPCPVLIFGNQKSGTSAFAALLGQATGQRAALDLQHEYESPTYQRVVAGEQSIADFVQRNRLEFSCPIVKEPNFLVLWRGLLARFPESPRVLVVRDPRDNLRSILDRLGIAGDREELEDDARAANGPGWSLYLDGRWLGIDSTHYIEVMAHRWNLGYEFLCANRADTVLVRYEDFVADREGSVSQAARAVGLTPRYPLGAAAERQYQPRGSARRDWQAVFGAENLARIECICAEGMSELGYERAG